MTFQKSLNKSPDKAIALDDHQLSGVQTLFVLDFLSKVSARK